MPTYIVPLQDRVGTHKVWPPPSAGGEALDECPMRITFPGTEQEALDAKLRRHMAATHAQDVTTQDGLEFRGMQEAGHAVERDEGGHAVERDALRREKAGRRGPCLRVGMHACEWGGVSRITFPAPGCFRRRRKRHVRHVLMIKGG